MQVCALLYGSRFKALTKAHSKRMHETTISLVNVVVVRAIGMLSC